MTMKDTYSSSSFLSSMMLEVHAHPEEQTAAPVEFEIAAAMLEGGEEELAALAPPLLVSSPETAAAAAVTTPAAVTVEQHDENWKWTTSSSILSSLSSTSSSTSSTTMPMIVLRTVLVMMGIFLLIFRRTKRKWKKAVRTEKLRRLDRQEEALRHRILLKTVEKERDYLKRKLKNLQLDNEILEQQVEELCNQRQDLYDTLEVMSRLSPSWSQPQRQQQQQDYKDFTFPEEEEEEEHEDIDADSDNKRSMNTDLLLTPLTEYLIQEHHDNDDHSNEAIVAGACYDQEDDVDNQSRVSASSRSTLATEPVSPPTNKVVKNVAVQCFKIVA
eukprot:CAMPEP_0113453872 /NCGR_PEP_ID=MMETSP0014_2-20120614/7576_1 /TAXON_ID=2857 /ORGANISM="Nitzschia sp." /LENGTH=328 /DNA_ID=CAMNT_0000345269 /DNA_START=139 /DNA_END=1125 /DNA_ORIENTATION=+ /assembly_acc=CAM_ASM_000159